MKINNTDFKFFRLYSSNYNILSDDNDDDDDDDDGNCFCGIVDQWRALSLISSWDHYQRFSWSLIFTAPQARPEPAQNLSSDIVELSYLVTR